MREGEPFPPQIPEFQKEWFMPRFWTVWLGFLLVWLLTFFPARSRHAMAKLVAKVAYRFNPKRRHIVNVNLALAFDHLTAEEVDSMARAHFFAMARSFLDMGLLWFSSDQKLKRQFRLLGLENLETARHDERNVIYHVAHVAGLEFGAVAVGSAEPAVGLYQSMKNPLVNWQIARARHRFGNRIFRRKDGFRAFVKAVKSGKALYSLTDEDFGREKSSTALFYAHPKSTLTMTARIAAMADAVVIPLVTSFDWESSQYVVELGEAVEGLIGNDESKDSDGALLNQALMSLISKAPEEYMWTLKIYRSVLGNGVYRTT